MLMKLGKGSTILISYSFFQCHNGGVDMIFHLKIRQMGVIMFVWTQQFSLQKK